MSTKQYILRMRKEINEVIESDPRCQEYSEELEGQSQDITDTFKRIQNLDEDFEDPTERSEMLMTLNQTMEDLNKLNKLTQEDYEKYLGERFSEFKDRYPGLFKMFLNSKNIDNDALNHCLDTFTLLERGAISIEQGKEMGWNRFHKKE